MRLQYRVVLGRLKAVWEEVPAVSLERMARWVGLGGPRHTAAYMAAATDDHAHDTPLASRLHHVHVSGPDSDLAETVAGTLVQGRVPSLESTGLWKAVTDSWFSGTGKDYCPVEHRETCQAADAVKAQKEAAARQTLLGPLMLAVVAVLFFLVLDFVILHFRVLNYGFSCLYCIVFLGFWFLSKGGRFTLELSDYSSCIVLFIYTALQGGGLRDWFNSSSDAVADDVKMHGFGELMRRAGLEGYQLYLLGSLLLYVPGLAIFGVLGFVFGCVFGLGLGPWLVVGLSLGGVDRFEDSVLEQQWIWLVFQILSLWLGGCSGSVIGSGVSLERVKQVMLTRKCLYAAALILGTLLIMTFALLISTYLNRCGDLVLLLVASFAFCSASSYSTRYFQNIRYSAFEASRRRVFIGVSLGAVVMAYVLRLSCLLRCEAMSLLWKEPSVMGLILTVLSLVVLCLRARTAYSRRGQLSSGKFRALNYALGENRNLKEGDLPRFYSVHAWGTAGKAGGKVLPLALTDHTIAVICFDAITDTETVRHWLRLCHPEKGDVILVARLSSDQSDQGLRAKFRNLRELVFDIVAFRTEAEKVDENVKRLREAVSDLAVKSSGELPQLTSDGVQALRKLLELGKSVPAVRKTDEKVRNKNLDWEQLEKEGFVFVSKSTLVLQPWKIINFLLLLESGSGSSRKGVLSEVDFRKALCAHFGSDHVDVVLKFLTESLQVAFFAPVSARVAARQENREQDENASIVTGSSDTLTLEPVGITVPSDVPSTASSNETPEAAGTSNFPRTLSGLGSDIEEEPVGSSGPSASGMPPVALPREYLGRFLCLSLLRQVPEKHGEKPSGLHVKQENKFRSRWDNMFEMVLSASCCSPLQVYFALVVALFRRALNAGRENVEHDVYEGVAQIALGDDERIIVRMGKTNEGQTLIHITLRAKDDGNLMEQLRLLHVNVRDLKRRFPGNSLVLGLLCRSDDDHHSNTPRGLAHVIEIPGMPRNPRRTFEYRCEGTPYAVDIERTPLERAESSEVVSSFLYSPPLRPGYSASLAHSHFGALSEWSIPVTVDSNQSSSTVTGGLPTEESVEGRRGAEAPTVTTVTAGDTSHDETFDDTESFYSAHPEDESGRYTMVPG